MQSWYTYINNILRWRTVDIWVIKMLFFFADPVQQNMYRQFSDSWKNPAFEASFWNWEWRMRGEETRDGQSPIDRWRVFMPPPIPPFPHSPPWNHPLGLLCQSVFVTQYNLGLSDKGRNLFWIFCFSSSSSSSSLSLPSNPTQPHSLTRHCLAVIAVE